MQTKAFSIAVLPRASDAPQTVEIEANRAGFHSAVILISYPDAISLAQLGMP